MVQTQKEKTSTHGLVQMEQNFTVSMFINTLEVRKGWLVLTQRLLPKPL